MMPVLSNSEVLSLKPYAVAVKPGLCDLIGNSEDRFAHGAVHIISLFPCLKINAIFCFVAHEQNKTIIRKKKMVRAVPLNWAEESLD